MNKQQSGEMLRRMAGIVEEDISDPLETYKGKWRNLTMTTRGNFWAAIAVDSEETAIKVNQDFVKRIENLLKERSKDDVWIAKYGTKEPLYLWSERLCCIPIPVRS